MLDKNYLNIFLIQAILLYVIGTDGLFKYIIVIAFSLYFLCDRKLHIHISLFKDKNVQGIVGPVVFLSLVGSFIAIFSLSFNMYSFRYLCFYLMPIILAISFEYYIETNEYDFSIIIEQQFFLLTFFFLVNGITRYTSTDLMEDATKAFIFGVFFIYFFHERSKHKRYIAFCIFLLPLIYLANKRIVFLALSLIVVLLMTVYRNSKKRSVINGIVIIALLVSIIAYLYAIRNGILEKMVIINDINDQGRVKLYNFFKDDYTLSLGFLGKGIGYVMDQIQYGQGVYWSRALRNLHNDWLHFWIETGSIGMLGYYFLTFRSLKKNISIDKNALTMCMILYTFLNYLTDNISIYISYTFILYFMLVHFRKRKGIKERIES